MRFLIFILLLTGTVLQSEPKNIYAEEPYQDGDYYDGEDVNEEETETNTDTIVEFTPKEQKELDKLFVDILPILAIKVNTLGAENYKDRKKGIHELTLYILGIFNTPKDSNHYKYRYEKLKFISQVFVNTYKKSNDIEFKFNLLKVMQYTHDLIQEKALRDYAEDSNAFGSDDKYVRRMLDIYFKDFLKENKIKKVIDRPNKIKDGDD